jgi:hypothetical protein
MYASAGCMHAYLCLRRGSLEASLRPHTAFSFKRWSGHLFRSPPWVSPRASHALTDGTKLDGCQLRATLGTTKYCNYFLRNAAW